MCKLIIIMLSHPHSDPSAAGVTYYIGSQHHHLWTQTPKRPPLLLFATKLFGNFPLVVSIIPLLLFPLLHPGFGPLDFHLNLPMTVVLSTNCSVLPSLLETRCLRKILPSLCFQTFALPYMRYPMGNLQCPLWI